MSGQTNTLEEGMQALHDGGIAVADVCKLIDRLLNEGVTVEDLRDAIVAGRAKGLIDDSQQSELIGAISASLTLFAGSDEADPERTEAYVPEDKPASGPPADPMIGRILRDRFIVDEVIGV